MKTGFKIGFDIGPWGILFIIIICVALAVAREPREPAAKVHVPNCRSGPVIVIPDPEELPKVRTIKVYN